MGVVFRSVWLSFAVGARSRYPDEFDRTEIKMRETCIPRRTFLNVAAAAPLAVSLKARAQAGARQAFQLRYILASSMYGTTKLAEVLAEVKKVRADSIDIWPRGHANQREQIEEMGHARFRELLGQYDVSLGIITRYDLGPLRLRDELKVLKGFGGRLIICGAGKGKGDTLKEQVRSFVEQMQPHVRAAEELGLTIGIENHGGSLLNTPDSLRYFAEFAKSPRLGVALAPYHLPQDESMLARLIEELGPKLVHFYAWQHGMGCATKLPKEQEMLQMPGRGSLDFAPLLAALRKIGYHGWTEVFMHPVPRGIPILDSTAQVTAAINESRRYLEKCLTNV